MPEGSPIAKTAARVVVQLGDHMFTNGTSLVKKVGCLARYDPYRQCTLVYAILWSMCWVPAKTSHDHLQTSPLPRTDVVSRILNVDNLRFGKSTLFF